MDDGAGSDFLQLHVAAAPARGRTEWLVDALRTAVVDGRLPPGSPLPATRNLARDLGLSRGVVVEAYRRLADEGLVTARTGAGTTVNGPLDTAVGAPAETPARSPVLPIPTRDGADVEFNLSPGVPDLAAFPRSAWLRAERAVLTGLSAGELGYGDPRGNIRLRAELAARLMRTRGVRAHPDDIVVVSGVAQALALLADVLRRRGTTRVAVEDPGSRGARDQLVHWGLHPVAVPVDADGLVVDELARTTAQAVLITPAHQFPTGVVLAPQRRRALLDWAAGTGGLVVEDDYDAEHRYDRAPVPALYAGAPQHVAHTGSTSKTLAPGMRLGWLIPPRDLHADVVAAKHATDLGSPGLPQLVLAHLMEGGEYDRHLRLVRARQRTRRDAVLAALAEHLPEARVEGVAAGLHLLLTLPDTPDLDDTVLAEDARRGGVLLHPLSWHRERPGTPGLILGYAAHSPDRLHDAVRRIAAAVRAR
jgi:GntR family transcriptional regulator / MocR family aminotransferase